MIISHFSDDVWHGTTNEKFEEQLDNRKNGTHEFADCDSRTKLLVRWSDIVFIYNQEENNIVKKSPLDYQTLYPINFEKKKKNSFLWMFSTKKLRPNWKMISTTYHDLFFFGQARSKKKLNIKEPINWETFEWPWQKKNLIQNVPEAVLSS